MNKPILTAEQAEAIRLIKGIDYSIIGIIISKSSRGKEIINPKYSALNGLDADTIMAALVNGYEIEKSSEEKLREYYTNNERLYFATMDKERREYLAILTAIEHTLDLLGIKIKGINA